MRRADVDALIGRDYATLRALLFRSTGDPQVAADLLNEAIYFALDKHRTGQIARPDQIAGYVFQVAMNHSNRSCADDAPDELDKDSAVLDRIIRIMRTMPSARDRTILVRFYLDEAGRAEICRELNLTPAQFARVLHRARLRLRGLLEADGLKGTDLFAWISS